MPARATIVDGKLTLVFNRQINRENRTNVGLLARESLPDGITIADVELGVDYETNTREVIVQFLKGDCPEARRVFIEWAQLTGYYWLWFPDDAIKLDPFFPIPAQYQTSCPTCRREITNGGVEFTAAVRRDGMFPNNCMVCRNPLPQWTAVEASAVTACEIVAEDAEATSEAFVEHGELDA